MTMKERIVGLMQKLQDNATIEHAIHRLVLLSKPAGSRFDRGNSSNTRNYSASS